MKVSELQVEVLNYFVAKAEGLLNSQGLMFADSSTNYPDFCTEWELARPIIEREMSTSCGRMCIKNETYATETHPRFSAEYTGHNWDQQRKMYGPTPLIAAMRTYVASKFGSEVTLIGVPK